MILQQALIETLIPLKVLHSALVIHRILFLQVGEGMANTVRLQ